MNILKKIYNKVRLFKGNYFSSRYCKLPGNASFISFTFDDFPKSAYHVGGKILKSYGVEGTYYISTGLLNNNSQSGEIADIDTIKYLISDGHELGCHTYSHIDTWNASPDLFEMSIIENQKHINKIISDYKFSTFAYPYGNVTPKTKRIASKYFACCRGGFQSFNSNVIDLNNLKAFFIDNHQNESILNIKTIISENYLKKGWLIFGTHGVEESNCAFSCTPEKFDKIVQFSVDSGAIVMSVNRVMNSINQGIDRRHTNGCG